MLSMRLLSAMRGKMREPSVRVETSIFQKISVKANGSEPCTVAKPSLTRPKLAC